MRYLLDTHAFLWFVLAEDRLSRAAREAMIAGGNVLLLSTASLLEIAIKHGRGKLVLEGEFLGEQGNRAGFSATGTLNRLDYGLVWNRIVDGTGMLGDEVEISVVVALVRQPAG